MVCWWWCTLIGDGASLRPLIGDVLTAYNARRYGFTCSSPLPVQYADYSLWYDRVLGDAADGIRWPRVNRVLGRAPGWRTRSDLCPPSAASTRPSGHGDFVDRVLSESAVAALRSLAAQSGVTLFSGPSGVDAGAGPVERH